MDRKALATVIVDILSHEAGVVAIYLFGSYAEDRAHRDSDVDVAVLLDRSVHPTAAGRFDARLRLTTALMHRLKARDVDLVVLNDAPPTIARAVVIKGLRLFVADDSLVHAYERDVLLRAADLEPFLRRARALKLDAIRR